MFTYLLCAFIALMLLVGRQEGHPACKKTELWGAGVLICLERGADLHIAQLMPLPLTVCCSSKIQIGFSFLVLAHLGSPGRRAIKRLHVCTYLLTAPMFCVHSNRRIINIDDDSDDDDDGVYYSDCIRSWSAASRRLIV